MKPCLAYLLIVMVIKWKRDTFI